MIKQAEAKSADSHAIRTRLKVLMAVQLLFVLARLFWLRVEQSVFQMPFYSLLISLSLHASLQYRQALFLLVVQILAAHNSLIFAFQAPLVGYMVVLPYFLLELGVHLYHLRLAVKAYRHLKALEFGDATSSCFGNQTSRAAGNYQGAGVTIG